MEPRAIEPQEIRVGDKVRLTREFTVVAAAPGFIESDTFTYGPRLYDWTLLDRPEPPREVGSHWRDPETDVEYVFTDFVRQDCGGALYVPYRNSRGATAVAAGWSGRDGAIIARLVPLDGA